MTKVMIFLTRREDLSREGFAAWWLGPHWALARGLEGLRRTSFNLLPEGGPCDAVVEQWFDDEDAARRCYETPLGRQVGADSGAHTKTRVRLTVAEHSFDLAAAGG